MIDMEELEESLLEEGSQGGIIFSCYGYVERIEEDGVVVVLDLQDGKAHRRRFPNQDKFREAGVYHENSTFIYEIIRQWDGKIRSCVYAARPSETNARRVIKGLDLSVFDGFSVEV